jgi:hypothetical protein
MDTDKTSLPTVGHGLDVAVGEASTAESLGFGMDSVHEDMTSKRT